MDGVVELVGTEWVVFEIDGAVVSARRPPTIGFGDDGRAYGTGGVNRWFGTFELADDQLRIGPAGSTMMAGPPELMAQEQRFLRAVEGTHAVTVGGGEIVLERAGATLRLRPADAQAPRTDR
jgi:heat shock protein HslJ